MSLTSYIVFKVCTIILDLGSLLFQKRFWCGSPPNGTSVHATDMDIDQVDRGEKAEFFEDSPNNVTIGVKIRNLTRVCTHE